MDIEAGSAIGDYQVVAILGAGGMGKVYKVRNVISDRIEAMKVLLPDLATQPELADRFLREIKLQASLEHPNIAALHTAVRVQNQLLMLMEFVEGITLDQKLKDGPLPVREAVDYISQVLAALDYAHARDVVHRDIKPANMMLTPAGVVKLMDFGIAKGATDQRLTMTGTTLGSLYYMSPEQIRGATTLDPRADLYSVGVSLYELVTGKRPFDGDSQFAIMSAHLEKEPVPPLKIDPRLPQALNDAILIGVAKAPETRFQTAAAFRNALGSIFPAAAEAPVAAAAPVAVAAAAPVAATPRPASRGSKRGVWMALGGLAAALAIVGFIQFGPRKGTRAAPAAATPPPAAVTPATVAPTSAPAPALTPGQQPAAQAPVGQLPSAPPPAVTQPAVKKPLAPHHAQMQPQPQPAAQQPAQTIAQPAPLEAQPRPQPPAPAPAPAPAAPSRAELQQIRERIVMLSARAGGIHSSLGTLQRSQAASGLNLRGDMQQAATLMDSYLQGAGAALNASDAASAKDFANKAEQQIEILEKFLNR